MDAISMQRLRLTKSMKGGFLRNPTDITPAAWIAGVLKVLHSLPDIIGCWPMEVRNQDFTRR